MKNLAIIGAVVLVILGVGYFATSNPEPTATPATETTSATETNDASNEPVAADMSDTMTDDELMDEIDAQGSVMTDASGTAVPGSYQDYSAGALAASEADTNVLFFAASWCPSCRALDDNIVTNQAAIPDGVAIFKADYDAETALKQQYGVVRQHSVVTVAADGSLESSVTHPATLEQLVAGL